VNFFWAGGWQLERGASSPAAAALKGGRRGDRRFFRVDFAWHAGPGLFFPPCRTVSALPIGSCHAGAGAGAPAVYLGSNMRQHVFGLADSTPIWVPSPKYASATF
jgi:hypothetical protein